MLLDRGWCCLFTILVAVLVQKVSQTPEKHSLIYYYTELAKDLSPLGFTEFTALGLLDDRKLYSYDGKNQITGAEQDWKKEDLNVDHLIQNPEELQWLRDWFRKQSQIVVNCTWPCPDLHVLQRRFGCEVEELQNGSLQLLKAIEEYGFDGEDLITFDTNNLTWKAEVPKARMIKMIWDKEQGRNQITGIYLKNECRENLFKSLSFSSGRRKTPSAPGFQYELRKKESFGKTTLICVATGFYPKDLKMRLRRITTSVPDHLIKSSGVRPNGDGTYQLRKSVDVQEEDTAEYNCRIEHSSLDSPVTCGVSWWDQWKILFYCFISVVAVIFVLCVFYITCKSIWMAVKCQENGQSRAGANLPSGRETDGETETDRLQQQEDPGTSDAGCTLRPTFIDVYEGCNLCKIKGIPCTHMQNALSSS